MPKIFISGLLLLAAVVLNGQVDAQPLFQIKTKRDDDRIAVKTEQDGVVFSIESPAGISSVVIERAGEKWPDAVRLHLRLKGLENFRADHDRMKLETAVSSQDGQLRQWKDGREDEPLDPQSPYWLGIRRLGRDGQPARTIPLPDGYFEVTLPKAFFEGNPTSISLSWIDFYRG